MKILVGDNLGLTRLVDLKKKEVEVKYGEPKADNSIIWLDKLSSYNNSYFKNEFAILTKDQFKIVNPFSQEMLFDISANTLYNNSLKLNNYDISQFYNSATKKTFSSGFIKYDTNSLNADFMNIFLFNNKGEISIVSNKSSSNTSNKKRKSSINSNSSNKGTIADFKLSEFTTEMKLMEQFGTLEKVVPLKSNENEFIALYQDLPLRIFDINKETCTFKSKNVANDELDLKVPIWDTDIVEDPTRNGVFYVSTAYGKVS